MRDFEDRFNEHRLNIEKRSKELPIYEELANNVDKISYEVLFDCGEANTSHTFERSEVEAIELAFITYLQPKGNTKGLSQDFIFRGE